MISYAMFSFLVHIILSIAPINKLVTPKLITTKLVTTKLATTKLVATKLVTTKFKVSNNKDDKPKL